ncbi:hypothetical protein A5816_003077 [Enterococcus sp. 3G1_DIV0629]|uniref:hypothetical protein n=1 Tax=Enterococcus sp. (strain 3G1_DIV0629) TaxID=1834176 RepID=UPI000A33B7AB|nr:hypothetical protein [Enterococcus sp. 3G1_DIV0629]OTO21972.1 hypothetical protein A5816_003077 [Enterococcus sp. 3G1_DIV0629]
MIKIINTSGDIVYINPNFITSICYNDLDDFTVIDLLGGGTIFAEGSPEKLEEVSLLLKDIKSSENQK